MILTGCGGDNPAAPQNNPSQINSYRITLTALNDGGTYAGQTFTATFQIDVGSLKGVGAETLSNGIRNFSFDFPRGLSLGSNLGTAYFQDGTLWKVSLLSSGAYGFNTGFTLGQVPDAIENGRWFGYLNAQALLDGFGTYTIAPADLRDYTITVTCLDGGTYANQVFDATFQIDMLLLVGSGSETLNGAINNFSFNFPRGLTRGAGLGTAYFQDGTLTKILLLSSGVYGFNTGFSPDQVPDAIENGRWFGYLNAQAVVDGFGTYTIK